MASILEVDRQESKNTVILYVLLVTIYTIPWYILVLSTNPVPEYVLLMMWSPCLAALTTVKLRKLDVNSLGWGWSSNAATCGAYLLPFFYAAIAYILIWLTGLGGLDSSYVISVKNYLGWKNTPDWLVLLFYVFDLATNGMVRSVSSALGEEIGWRGLMGPVLTDLFGLEKASVLTGIVWAFWHYPILIFGKYNQGTEWWYGSTCFTVTVVSISLVLTWIRLKTGSLWPCAIFHASHNLWIQSFYTPLTRHVGNKTAYAIDEFGFVLPLTILLLALVIIYLHRKEMRRNLLT